ncbi:MAG: beta-ketoacyl-[acyl-carrier-protein] synthase family protein, partial [Planctomycetes bacterium]|nr:beta-ketoacyl-[acyl-carrier-protein] synthase family protein [Planctomycetota bacterium]
PAAAGTDLQVKFGGELKDFDARQFIKPRKSMKIMCHEIQVGFSATMLALEDAGLNKEDFDADRLGVVLGSEMFYCELNELADAYRKCVVDGEIKPELWGEGAMSDLYPLWMLKYLPNMVACHTAIALDARGPNNTITLDEVSSLLALIEAVCIIQRGAADVMLAGGSGTRVNLTRMLYRGDRAWSHRSDDPASACRPFDARRDGSVIGEGAGALVLERREFAEARGAKILARVLGFGRSFESCADARRPTANAIRNSIRAALQSCGLAPGDIGHVNAHGASTIEDDRMEAQVIRECLGDVPVTAPKSYFGCLGAGSGAVEMLASVLGVAEGIVPATLNYEYPDPECPVNVVHGQPLRTDNGSAMVLNQTETGQTAAVVIAAV